MAPIRVKWDPEILAGGFHPSSIFDEVAINTTAHPAANITAGLKTLAEEVARQVATFATNLTTTAPVSDSTGTTVSPAPNITAGLTDSAEEVVRRVADLATSFITTPTPTTTPTTPSWPTTTPTSILRRVVEKVATRPEVAVEHVRNFYIYVVYKLSGYFWCKQARNIEITIFIFLLLGGQHLPCLHVCCGCGRHGLLVWGQLVVVQPAEDHPSAVGQPPVSAILYLI